MMYEWRNVEVPSCNHFCSWKAISITYCECVFVASGTQRKMSMRHDVMWSVRLYNIFFSTLSHENTIFGKIFYWIHVQNVCFDFLYEFCLKHFSV